MKRFFAPFFVALLAALPLLVQAAPNVPLHDFSGAERNLSEFVGKGRWVVVTIWAHDCPICNAEIYQMDFFHSEHRDRDAVVLGVSLDGMAHRDEAANFVERHGLEFSNLLVEPQEQLLRSFGGGRIFGTPTFLVYDPEGRLRAKQDGPVTQEVLEHFIATEERKRAEAMATTQPPASGQSATAAP
ncbi:MAG: TlpA family protein disulfide reductase [Gammaproteobacteria bacterium]|nr:TlpA family protein disulfide reductase [Gammaproteobacteria bacterium]